MDETGTATGRVGERLAAARHALGLSIEDIATRTRVPKRSLELIEAGTAEGLPALTYSAGFVRTYATTVGLDGAECALAFRAEMGRPAPYAVSEPYEPADPARVPGKLLAIVALILAVLVAGGYAVWRGDGLFGGGAEDRARLAAGTDPALYPPPEAAQPQAPLAGPTTPPSAPAAAPTGPVTVTVTAREEVWVRIGERDGASLFTGTMTPGQSVAIPATAADPVLRTSRPQSIDVKVGETLVPTLAPPDTLIRAASLKREALLPPTGAAAPLVAPAAAP